MRRVRLVALAAIVLALAGCGTLRRATEETPGPTTSTVPAGSAQDFFVNVGDRVFFNDNSADLTPTSIETLDKQAAWLLRYTSYTVTVEGHSDERGDKAKNLALGNRRAQAVRNYLLSKGLPPQRLKFVSYGRDRRVATCNDISCWSQNRRAVTVLDGVGDVVTPAQAPIYSARPPGR
jgi:peptidoglycan-associated lipoprotein